MDVILNSEEILYFTDNTNLDRMTRISGKNSILNKYIRLDKTQLYDR